MELTCVWGEVKEYADVQMSVRRQEEDMESSS
jgi:hypothetical protein